MTVMIVTFFNASGIDFGNFLNAHLRFKRLSPNYVISTAMTAWVGAINQSKRSFFLRGV
jgi:hypothetical protein